MEARDDQNGACRDSEPITDPLHCAEDVCFVLRLCDGEAENEGGRSAGAFPGRPASTGPERPAAGPRPGAWRALRREPLAPFGGTSSPKVLLETVG